MTHRPADDGLDVPPEAPPADGLKGATQRPASPLQTMRAVAWSFLGIRRSSGLEHDVQKLNPVYVVIGGLIGAGVFVGGVVLLVRWVVSSGVAT